MSHRKIKRETVRSILRRVRFFHILMAGACVLAGYVIVAGTDATQKAYREIRDIKDIISEVDGAKNLDELKQKVKNNPGILDKVNPEMIEKIRSNPLFQKKIGEKMKGLE